MVPPAMPFCGYYIPTPALSGATASSDTYWLSGEVQPEVICAQHGTTVAQVRSAEQNKLLRAALWATGADLKAAGWLPSWTLEGAMNVANVYAQSP